MRTESTPGARGPVFCGVDTHADSHWLCVLDWRGRKVLSRQFPADAAGYEALAGAIAAAGEPACVAMEGTSSYGAGLTIGNQRGASRCWRGAKGELKPIRRAYEAWVEAGLPKLDWDRQAFEAERKMDSKKQALPNRASGRKEAPQREARCAARVSQVLHGGAETFRRETPSRPRIPGGSSRPCRP